jgi:hypothetical protein
MSLLIFGSVWFWIVALITLGSIVWFLESALLRNRDNGGGMNVTGALIVFGVLYYLFGSKQHIVNGFEYIRDHPASILGWIALYLFIGVIWAFIKWYFFLLKRKDQLIDEKKYSSDKTIKIPTAAENKFRILTWMNYWMFSVIWTVLDEPVKRFFNFIFKRFEAWFDKISKSIFNDVNVTK